MPSDAVTAALRDMEHHINLATHFIAGLDYDGAGNVYRHDL
jgi:hypothetical protein